MKTMTCSAIVLALASGLLAAPSAADAQRQTTQGQTMQRPAPEAEEQSERAPCRDGERGRHCRVRAADVGVRQETGANELGGADPGWGVRQEAADAPDAENFGGEDPGWVRDRLQARPRDGAAMARPVSGGQAPAEHMECEFCDDDEDLPQGPIDNEPGPAEPESPDEPSEEEDDCVWRNPPEGPDQEFCDE